MAGAGMQGAGEITVMTPPTPQANVVGRHPVAAFYILALAFSLSIRAGAILGSPVTALVGANVLLYLLRSIKRA